MPQQLCGPDNQKFNHCNIMIHHKYMNIWLNIATIIFILAKIAKGTFNIYTDIEMFSGFRKFVM